MAQPAKIWLHATAGRRPPEQVFVEGLGVLLKHQTRGPPNLREGAVFLPLGWHASSNKGRSPRRACRSDALTSAFGYKETSSRPKSTSALPPKADILVAVTDFRL